MFSACATVVGCTMPPQRFKMPAKIGTKEGLGPTITKNTLLGSKSGTKGDKDAGNCIKNIFYSMCGLEKILISALPITIYYDFS